MRCSMLINIILACAAIGALALAVFFRGKYLASSSENQKNDTILLLYSITYSDEGFKEKLRRISLAIMKKISSDYVSFIVFDDRMSPKIIHTNIPEFDHIEFLAFIKQCALNQNPQVYVTKDGVLPHGAERAIKHLYYIPLIRNAETIGCVVLEKENTHDIDALEKNVFDTIVSTVSKAFAFIIFAYNLNETSYKDALTGTLNRAGFEKHPKELSGDYTAIMCDIDLFKRVNDTYGHDAGDQVIKSFAKALSDNCRPSDNVFRLGGEEFLILMKGVNANTVISKINKMRDDIAHSTIKYNDFDINITASFGLCDTFSTKNLDAIVKSADVALYHSKNNGRNRATVFTNALTM